MTTDDAPVGVPPADDAVALLAEDLFCFVAEDRRGLGVPQNDRLATIHCENAVTAIRDELEDLRHRSPKRR